MDAKQLKQEIMGIVKFEGVAMSSSELWEALTLDGQEGIEKKLYNNCLTSLISTEYLEKVPDEERLNRYRYLVTAKGEEWIEKQINTSAKSATEKPDQDPKPQTNMESDELATEKKIKPDKAVFDELYMVYMPGMEAKICETLLDAQAQASRFVSESGTSTSIHRIYSEPVLECRPVTTVEFKEVS